MPASRMGSAFGAVAATAPFGENAPGFSPPDDLPVTDGIALGACGKSTSVAVDARGTSSAAATSSASCSLGISIVEVSAISSSSSSFAAAGRCAFASVVSPAGTARPRLSAVEVDWRGRPHRAIGQPRLLAFTELLAQVRAAARMTSPRRRTRRECLERQR